MGWEINRGKSVEGVLGMEKFFSGKVFPFRKKNSIFAMVFTKIPERDRLLRTCFRVFMERDLRKGIFYMREG